MNNKIEAQHQVNMKGILKYLDGILLVNGIILGVLILIWFIKQWNKITMVLNF